MQALNAVSIAGTDLDCQMVEGRDVNNIGIDFIGGEGTCPDATRDLTRDGLCRGNVVYKAKSNYGGGFGAGIYVDGGRDIVVERNTVYECDLGIEVGAEVSGRVTQGIKVRDNLIYNNEKVGLVFGGYDYGKTGKVSGCSFLNKCSHLPKGFPSGPPAKTPWLLLK